MKLEKGFLDGRYPYLRAGSGDRLALVLPGSEDLMFSDVKHAWLFGKAYFSLFPKNYSVILVGYENIPSGKTPIDIAIDIGKVLKRNHVIPDVVLGLSFGGLVAMAFGVVNPRLAKGLVIVSAAHELSEGGLTTVRAWMEYARTGDLKRLFGSFLGLFKRKRYTTIMNAGLTVGWGWLRNNINSLSSLVQAYEAALRIKDRGIAGFLPAIKIPVLVLGGSGDQLFPSSVLRELASLIPGAELSLIEGETHTMLFENGSACKAAIGPFLKKMENVPGEHDQTKI
nr:alpha/beta hydrolase [Candidatus Sigynarchaeota archaeon]